MSKMKEQHQLNIILPDRDLTFKGKNEEETLFIAAHCIHELIEELGRATEFHKEIHNRHNGKKDEFDPLQTIDGPWRGMEFKIRLMFTTNPATHEVVSRFDLFYNPEE